MPQASNAIEAAAQIANFCYAPNRADSNRVVVFCNVHPGFEVAAGADLDPLEVLSALSAEMPLSAGVDILSHLLCERLHRHRQGSIIRSLHKACNLSASVDKAEVPSFSCLLYSLN